MSNAWCRPHRAGTSPHPFVRTGRQVAQAVLATTGEGGPRRPTPPSHSRPRTVLGVAAVSTRTPPRRGRARDGNGAHTKDARNHTAASPRARTRPTAAAATACAAAITTPDPCWDPIAMTGWAHSIPAPCDRCPACSGASTRHDRAALVKPNASCSSSCEPATSTTVASRPSRRPVTATANQNAAISNATLHGTLGNLPPAARWAVAAKANTATVSPAARAKRAAPAAGDLMRPH